jgi:hypothetical protein
MTAGTALPLPVADPADDGEPKLAANDDDDGTP